MKRLRRWALMLLGLGLLGWVAYGHRGDLAVLGNVGLGDIAWIVLLNFVGRFLSSESLRMQLRVIGYKVRAAEVFAALITTAYGNLFMPYAGLLSPAAYFQKRYGVPFTVLGASLAIFALIQVAGLMLMGGVCVLLLPWSGASSWLLGIFVAGLLAACCAPFAIVSHLGPMEWLAGRFPRLGSFRKAWRALFVEHPMASLGCLGMQVLSILLRAVRIYVCYRAVAAVMPMPRVVIVSVLGDLALLSGITPGGIGLREAIMSYGGGVLSVDAATTAAVALLDCAVMTVFVVVVAQGAIWYLMRGLGAVSSPAARAAASGDSPSPDAGERV